MSKLFFKGRQEKRESHENYGYQTKASHKPGSEKYPLELTVTSSERKSEVESLVQENELFANIVINTEDGAEENIHDLTGILNKPKTTVFDKTPGRNAPCSCGSEKKFKKCCG